ncbi:MAG: AmmeMemoRadiSam system protein B [Treponema sp.]|jgi:AmmeMemoRadiSam system protein B|nr:AmmeMemoRadiSam system protein B [Treponema sp.]
MNLRKMSLPEGWYPAESGEIVRFLRDKAAPRNAPAAIAPHAGWFFSGAIAAAAVSSLGKAETIAVIGGHLSRGASPLFAREDAVETPLGKIMIDGELRELVEGEVAKCSGTAEDLDADNTVEALLPMVRYFHPEARILWLRLPAEEFSFEAGKILARAALRAGRTVAVLGSTDLTHYGRNYGFSPRGSGESALSWVRNVNDRAFIDAVERGDPREILDRAERDRSACSAGAVLGALGYVAEITAEETSAGKRPSGTGAPAGRARLAAYGTSADAFPGRSVPGSFVGYGAFVFGG